MKNKKLITNLTRLLIYILFPTAILILGFQKQHLALLCTVLLYFGVFALLKIENIYMIIAGINDRNNKTLPALKFSFKAYKIKNSSIDTVNRFVYLLLKAGKYDKSLEIIKKNEDREMTEKEHGEFLSNYALQLWKQNDINKSIEVYDDLIEIHRSTAVYVSYGYVVTLTNDLEKALSVNLEAYEYNSDSKGINDNLGLTYIKMGEFEKANDIYTDLIKKEPQFPDAYYNMASLKLLQNETKEAKLYLEQALEFSFNGLSTISKEEIEKKIDQVDRLINALI